MEDGDEQLEEIEEEEEQGSGSPKKSEKKKRDLPCNTRIDELATPQKRMYLALWNEHGYHLPSQKVNNLKQLLQQLYAMTPEETTKYFAELRADAKAATMRKKLKQKLRKYLVEQHQTKQRERAYRLFRRLLQCGIRYAAENPVPPLVSIRLRYLSDIILEQLCDLRKVVVPNRSCTDKLGHFLISAADWMAIAVERLYYAAQLSINEMTNYEESRSQDLDQTPQSETLQDLGPPVGASTPKREPTEPYYSFIGTEPTTPKKEYSFEEGTKPVGASTPKKKGFSKSSFSGYSRSPTTIIQDKGTPKKLKGTKKENSGQFGMSPSFQAMGK